MARRQLSDQTGEELDVLQQRPAGRDRQWEQEQRIRGDVVTYRGIPRGLQTRIKKIAAKHKINIGEVIRRFLEYAVTAYESEALVLRPVEKVARRTLYPDDL